MNLPNERSHAAIGRPPRNADDFKKMRAHIIQSAEKLFREEGYAAISMRKLAKESKCAPMTLYAYFQSKAAILKEIWRDFFVELFEILEGQSKAIADPGERLKALCRSYVNYWVSQPERYRMVFMTYGVTQSEVGEFIDQTDVAKHFELFAQTLLDVGVPTKEIKQYSETLLCALNGIAHNHITISHFGWSPVDTMSDLVVSALVHFV